MRAALVLAAAFGAALLAGGCGGSRHAAPPATSSSTRSSACVLSARQRRDVVRAKQEIVRMHRLEQPLKTWHRTGPMALELAVERFLLDVGPLPVNVKGRLMALGKSAVGLCGDCFNAIEAESPVPTTRLGGSACGTP